MMTKLSMAGIGGAIGGGFGGWIGSSMSFHPVLIGLSAAIIAFVIIVIITFSWK